MFDSRDDIGQVGATKVPPHGLTGEFARWESLLAWLGSRERWVLLATVVFQLAVLGWMIAGKAAILWNGETVLLKVAPVDPRDLLRGDYVILSYEISRPPAEGMEEYPGQQTGTDLRQWVGRDVFVTLIPEPDGRHYRAGRYSLVPASDDELFIKGQLTEPWRITYGIESFFVQEGQGKEYEAAVRDRRLWAEVAIAADGQATLRRLHIE